MLCGHNITA